MPNKSSFKFIIVIFSFALGGWSLYNDLFWPAQGADLITLKQILSPLNLEWSLGTNPSGWINGQNYVNVFFDGLLLFGTVGYLASGYRQNTLLRFFYAVIFGSNAFQVLRFLLYFTVLRPLAGTHDTITNGRLVTDAEYLAMECIWMLASFIILRYLSRDREVAVTLAEQEGEQVGYFIEAPRNMRLMNYVADAIILSLIFHKEGLTLDSLQVPTTLKLGGTNGMVVPSAIVILICNWSYYALFEALFGITPGKILSGTRVVDDESHIPQFKTIAIRSLCRMVPFEALSFLGSRGWHDAWSDTYVVIDTPAGAPEQISTPEA